MPHVADLRNVKDPQMALKRRHFGKITGPLSPTVPPFATRSAHVDGDVEAYGGEEWERLKSGKSNGKLPLRTFLECSVPEPYRSPDWDLVPAKTSLRAEY
jgi:hypothetical protein